MDDSKDYDGLYYFDASENYDNLDIFFGASNNEVNILRTNSSNAWRAINKGNKKVER